MLGTHASSPPPFRSPRLRRTAALVLALALPVLALPAAAEAQNADEDDDTATVSVLSGAYTEDQAARGERVYESDCAACHAPGFFQAGTFLRGWAGRPVRSLFRRLSTTMPEDNPGSLRPREYADVIAYILSLNGYPTGPQELPDDAEALRGVLMEQMDGGGGT